MAAYPPSNAPAVSDDAKKLKAAHIERQGQHEKRKTKMLSPIEIISITALSFYILVKLYIITSK